MPRSAAIAAIAFTLLGLAVGVWFVLPGGGDRFADCRGGVIASGPASIGGPFTLVDHTGAVVTDKQVIDRPALLYFGYTFCPDICPVDTARIAEATEILEERGVMIRPVFVTIDPARDTPEVLADFVSVMHPRMVGLTGDESAVAAAAKAYRVYAKKADDDPEDYLMDHSTLAYLMAPEVGLLEVFRRDQPAEEIADRAACFIDKL